MKNALARGAALWRKTRTSRIFGRGPTALTLIAVLIALLVAAPILSVAASVFGEPGAIWNYAAETALPRYIFNSLGLAALVAVGVGVIGVWTAWLTTMRDFRGRAVLEVLLILPLAFPAYIIAYAYANLLRHHGPVQSALRDINGWGPYEDYWFPKIDSLPGAAAMLILVLYPYVYLLARAAFLNQSAAVLDVAQTLGASSRRVFFRVALPMARPAIATGVALALMETLADFGVVQHFGVQTLATGVYKAWFSYRDTVAAAQIASWLLLFVFILVAFERLQRGRRRVQDARSSFRALKRPRLSGWRAVGAWLICGTPVLFGFLVPFGLFAWMSAVDGHAFFGPRYIEYALNSLALAGLAALVIVSLSIFIAYATRLASSPLSRIAALAASMGYAVPGLIVGLGLLTPLGAVDNAFNSWMKAAFGVEVGLILIGTVVGLVLAYVVRFMSVSLQTVDAALGKVTPSMDHAARALGERPLGALRRVHAPMISGGVMTAALIVFVDVLKELPATLILKPGDFQTLATQAYNLAKDERYLEASTPALVIGIVGLLPVLLLSRRVRRARPGSEPKA